MKALGGARLADLAGHAATPKPAWSQPRGSGQVVTRVDPFRSVIDGWLRDDLNARAMLRGTEAVPKPGFIGEGAPIA